MPNSFLALTIGVELEYIFVFQEALLREYLNNTNNASKIIKNIPEDVRVKLRQSFQGWSHVQEKYMGWGLTLPPTFTVPDNYTKEKMNTELEKFGYRGYAGEILSLVKELLPGNTRVYDSFSKEYDRFDTWYLTHEMSVAGLPPDILERELRRASREVNGIIDWSSHGIELVSRVLPLEPASFEEIYKYLVALRGDEGSAYATFVNEHCGFHVHVGLPIPKDLERGSPRPTFELPTLQHLAYILVMYELAINKLFPSHRHEGSVAAYIDLKTNLEYFLEEPGRRDDWSESELKKFGIHDDPDTCYVQNPIGSTKSRLSLIPTLEMAMECEPFFAIARRKIFHPWQSIGGLAELMGGTAEGRIVNWTKLDNEDGSARTIEFRQHQGTLEIESVKWWVEFCAGLLRLAERNAREFGTANDYAGAGYRWQKWDKKLSVWDLLDMMEFPEEGVVHFRDMAARLNSDDLLEVRDN